MKKIYLKILTSDINPHILINEIWVKADKIMVKWEKINELWWKYWYNGFIINIQLHKYLDKSFMNDIDNIIKKFKNSFYNEVKLYIELNEDNNLHWTQIDNSILKFLWEKKIDLEII